MRVGIATDHGSTASVRIESAPLLTSGYLSEGSIDGPRSRRPHVLRRARNPLPPLSGRTRHDRPRFLRASWLLLDWVEQVSGSLADTCDRKLDHWQLIPCRHCASPSRQRSNSLSCSTNGSFKRDGATRPAHKIPDSPVRVCQELQKVKHLA